MNGQLATVRIIFHWYFFLLDDIEEPVMKHCHNSEHWADKISRTTTEMSLNSSYFRDCLQNVVVILSARPRIVSVAVLQPSFAHHLHRFDALYSNKYLARYKTKTNNNDAIALVYCEWHLPVLNVCQLFVVWWLLVMQTPKCIENWSTKMPNDLPYFFVVIGYGESESLIGVYCWTDIESEKEMKKCHLYWQWNGSALVGDIMDEQQQKSPLMISESLFRLHALRMRQQHFYELIGSFYLTKVEYIYKLNRLYFVATHISHFTLRYLICLFVWYG